MHFSNEQALEMLEAMVSYSVEDFEIGATKYIDSVKAERKARQALNRAIAQIANARELRDEALRYLIPETKFLLGKEYIIPPMDDPEFVLSVLFNGILDRYDEKVAHLFVEHLSGKVDSNEEVVLEE